MDEYVKRQFRGISDFTTKTWSREKRTEAAKRSCSKRPA